MMNRIDTPKTLLVISVANMAIGTLAILFSLMAGISNVPFGAISTETLIKTGMTASEQHMVAGFSAVSALTVVGGAISLVEGILGVRAANNRAVGNRMIMPVWVAAIVGVVFFVVALVLAVIQGELLISTILGLVGSCLMFWVINSIKGCS